MAEKGMKPILLKGHERSITRVKYNSDGDIIFTCSKDNKPMAWWTSNGERIGSYNGHQGAVWSCDVTHDSRFFLTASADATAKIWDMATGTELVSLTQQGPARSVGWAEGGKRFFVISNPLHASKEGASPKICVYDLPANFDMTPRDEWAPTISINIPKGIVGLWVPFNRAIMVGCEDGKIRLYDPKSGTQVFEVDAHDDKIHDIQFNKEKTLFITSSRDKTARLFDTKRMRCLKCYKMSVPVNSASIHPTFEHVMIGGGQDAMNVTTTDSRQGNFEVRFHKMVFEDMFGTVRGHFGPINTLCMHPGGLGFASGAEDGFIRVHLFDAEYMRMQGIEDRKLDKAVRFADELEAKSGGKALRKRHTKKSAAPADETKAE